MTPDRRIFVAGSLALGAGALLTKPAHAATARRRSSS